MTSPPPLERPAAHRRPHATSTSKAGAASRTSRRGSSRNPDLSGADRRYGPGPWQPRSRPEFRVGIVTVGGEEGRRLDVVQAAAIKEVLEWLHAERPRRRAPPPPGAE